MTSQAEIEALLRANMELNTKLGKHLTNKDDQPHFGESRCAPKPVFLLPEDAGLSKLWEKGHYPDPVIIKSVLRATKDKRVFPSDKALIFEFLRHNDQAELFKCLVGREKDDLESFLRVIESMSLSERQMVRQDFKNLKCSLRTPPREFHMRYTQLYNKLYRVDIEREEICERMEFVELYIEKIQHRQLRAELENRRLKFGIEENGLRYLREYHEVLQENIINSQKENKMETNQNKTISSQIEKTRIEKWNIGIQCDLGSRRMTSSSTQCERSSVSGTIRDQSAENYRYKRRKVEFDRKPQVIHTLSFASTAPIPQLSFCRLYHINATGFDGPNFEACIDTGATTTFIRQSVAIALGAVIFKSNPPKYRVANNKLAEGVGHAEMKIKFRPKKTLGLYMRAIVVPDQSLPYPCLLGLDFLKSTTIDYARDIVHHEKLAHPIFIVRKTSNSSHGPRRTNQKKNNYFDDVIPEIHLIELTSIKNEQFVDDPQINELIMNDTPSTELKPKIDINPALPEPIKQKYQELIDEYKDLFIVDMKNIGKYKGPEEYQIELTTERPVNAGTYDIPYHLQDNFRKHISELLEHGLIEECNNTSYSHGFIAVPKKDGSTRWASDMRKLNAVTVEDAFVLPKLSTLLHHMNGKSVFAQMDIFACFHQFTISEESRDCFGFINPLTGIRYRWTRCFFGLKNIPQYISYLMSNRVLRNKDIQEASVYIDDITCYNDDHEAMLINLRDVFSRVRQFGLKFKAPKCHFGYNQISQFGYQVSSEGVRADPSRVEKLEKIKTPTNKTQLHTSIGAIGYFRDVIPSFSKYSSILTPLLSDANDFIWTEDHQEAWNELIRSVKESITLSKPDPNAQMIVTSDASNIYHGGLLTQEVNGQKQIIAVHSAHIPKSCHSWSINVKEMLGVVKLCEKFEHYLRGHRFKLRVDNSSVYHILRNPETVWYRKAGPVARLLMRLSHFTFDVEHCKGTAENFQFADLLSRRNDVSFELTHTTSVKDILRPVFGEDDTDIYHSANLVALPELFSRQDIRDFVRQEQLTHIEQIRQEYGRGKNYSEEDDCKISEKLIVPRPSVQRLLEMVHRHHGIQRERALVRNCGLHWSGMTEDITNFIQSCPSCSRIRQPQPVKNIGVFPRAPSATFESVAIDHLIVGQGQNAINVLALIDHLSGFMLLEQVPSTTSEHTLQTLMRWILMYNITECSLRADNAFRTNEIMEQMNICNIRVRFGIPRNSRSNAEIERRFRMINERYRVYSLARDETLSQIPLTLAFVQAEINATPLNTVEVSPFEVVFGKTPKTFIGEPLRRVVADNLQDFADRQYVRMITLSSFLTAHHDRLADGREMNNDNTLLQVGDKVRVRITQPPRSNKLQHLPFSEEIGVIKEVRTATRSYVVEVTYPNRQPVQSLRHHRQVKKVVERFDHLNDHHNLPHERNDANQDDLLDQQALSDNSDTDDENDDIVINTRAGRVSRRPNYLQDFGE